MSTFVPSGESATDRIQSACPVKVRISAPVEAFHSLAVLSYEPVSTFVPSVENATEVTRLVCPETPDVS